jgi:uncharacterized protein (DUF1330 family)
MTVFYIGTYDIVDPSEFQKYPPIVLALLPRYGGAVLASGYAGSSRGGDGAHDERDHPLPIERSCSRSLQRP